MSDVLDVRLYIYEPLPCTLYSEQLSSDALISGTAIARKTAFSFSIIILTYNLYLLCIKDHKPISTNEILLIIKANI